MKLLSRSSAALSRRILLARLGAIWALLVSSILAPELLSAQTLSYDLGRISEQLDIRYYVAEKGEVPLGYILVGDSLGFYPNFLESSFDFKRTVVEYDAGAGLLYNFSVPGRYRFMRIEEQRDGYYQGTPRDLELPDLEISVVTFDDSIGRIRSASTARVWRDDIKYNLGKERVENVGKGLLSLDIPIALPHSIERIIGKGEETNLTVQGSERIQVSGVSNWCTGCPLSEGQTHQDKFPNLDLQQTLNVNLHGNIGEKLNVEIQHSASGVGDASASTNRVRLNYKGFKDDVIQLIEMGDTDLILSGAQLVSYSGTAKGLFGVKAIAQTGPLDLTVIASKEEGESARGSFSASGGQATSNEIPDYDFIDRQFFYFENPGPNYDNPGFGTIYAAVDAANDVEVFVSLNPEERGRTGEAEYTIDAYADQGNDGIENDTMPAVQAPWSGTFKRLTRDQDYELIQDYSAANKVHYIGIHLFQRLDNSRALAVRYRGLDKADDHQRFVTLTYQDIRSPKLMAELICPPSDEFDGRHPTWYMMWRNVYSLGAGQIDASTLNVRIEDTRNVANRDIHLASKISYLRLFGLDRFDKGGSPHKDDQIDDVPGILDVERGYLIFPWPEAFRPPSFLYGPIPSDPNFVPYIDRTDTLESKFDFTTLARDSIYDGVLTEQLKQQLHRYNIVVESSSGQRTFQLQAVDILEGSVVVTVDGAKLAAGTDYDVDYASGTVTLKGDVLSSMTPDSKVFIDYQHKPLAGGGKNSLLGVGANLNLSPSSRISGTFLYNSEGAPKYAPRLGEEPSRMMAADLNGNFVLYPKIMTSLVNVLPRVDTNNQSSLNVSAEVAVSMPNPNTKGEAIIDDMEGIEENNLVNLLRRSWYESSPALDANQMLHDSASVCEFYWYNPARTTEQQYLISSRRDLNPRLDERENSTINSLFIDPINPQPGQWCGIMTGFPGGGLDLTTAQYIEVWVNDFQPEAALRGGTVHIDFGRIDEDFHNPSMNKLDDEDKPPYTWTIDEDTGFDGDKACTYTNFSNPIWIGDKFVYDGINCRKGNAIHDTEDLNGNGRLDEANDYYTLSFDLAQNAVIDVRHDFRSDDPSCPGCRDYWNQERNKDSSWRLYRIDLSSVKLVGTAPRLDAIQHMRIWVEHPDSLQNASGRRLLEFAEIQFVGDRWQFNGVRDMNGALISNPDSSKLTVGAINNKDDPAHYRSPYRVQQEEGITNREQSLRLKFENFQDQTSYRVMKQFFGQGQNYGQYRTFQFFLFPYYNASNINFYLQIAYDSLNYYEVEVPLSEASDWMWVNLDLGDFTNLKLSGDSLVTKTIHDTADPSRTYTAKLLGNPTLFQIRYIFIGLRNKSGGAIPGGEVWLDDIKIGGVRRDIDTAERLSVAADFAGILQLSGSWQRTGPEFRSLQQSSGSGVTNSSLSLAGKTELDYFMPTARFDIPLNVRYNSSSSLPKYEPQSDIEILDPDVQRGLRTLNKDYSINVSIGRKGSTNFLMRNLFDNLRAGYSYSRRELFSPSARDTSTAQNGTLNYQLQFSRARQLSLLRGIKWRYWLSNLSYGSTIGEVVRTYYAQTGTEFVRRPITREGSWNNSFSTLYEPFESIKLNFDMREERVLAGNTFVQTNFGHTVHLVYQPVGRVFLLSALNPRFDFTSRYNEDLKPTIRQASDPQGTRNISSQRDINVVFDVDFGKYAMQLGEWAHIIAPGESSGRQLRYGDLQSTIPQKKEEWEKQFQQPLQPPTEGAVEPQITEEDRQEVSPGGAQPPVTQPSTAPQRPGSGLQGIGIKKAMPNEAAQGKPGQPAAPSDTTAGKGAPAAVDTTAKKGYNPLLPLKPLIIFIGKFDPLKMNIRMSHQSYYTRVYDRASLLYELGLSDGAGVPGKLGIHEMDPERTTGNLVVDLESGLGLTSNVDLKIKATTNVQKDDFGGALTKNTTTTWPNLDLNWRGVERYRIFAKYLQSSDLRIHFDRKTIRNARGEEIAYTASPNWNVDWKNALSSTMAIAYTKRSVMQDAQDLWEKSWSATVGLRYTIAGTKGFGIPLPILRNKKISFKSTLTTNLDVQYASTSRYNIKRPAGSLSVSPHASYQFSNNMTGAIGVSYKRSSGGEFGVVNQSIGVDVSAEFRF